MKRHTSADDSKTVVGGLENARLNKHAQTKDLEIAQRFTPSRDYVGARQLCELCEVRQTHLQRRKRASTTGVQYRWQIRPSRSCKFQSSETTAVDITITDRYLDS